MFKNVLIPIPSEGLTKTEVNKLRKIIDEVANKVTLVFVTDPMPPFVYSEYADAMVELGIEHKQANKNFAEKLFYRVGSKLTGIQFKSIQIDSGSVTEGILNASKKIKADLIVMHCHRKNTLSRIFLGDITHEVIIGTKIPVLVI